MTEVTFKVGDHVRCISDMFGGRKGFAGKTGTVRVTEGISIGVEFDHDFDGHRLSGVIKSCRGRWGSASEIVLINKGGSKTAAAPSPKIILQYELDTNPFELIYSDKELRKRIAELAEKRDLKRDSIKVYDIKRVRSVSLGVKITIK